MLQYKKYETPHSRSIRCNELNLCNKCSSQKHSAKNCLNNLDYPCTFCNIKYNIYALCVWLTRTDSKHQSVQTDIMENNPPVRRHSKKNLQNFGNQFHSQK